MNYKSVTARWNVQQQRCFSQKHQLATAKYLGCSSKIMEQGTLTWTNLKNNLSQLGSIPAINKTTLKPPNTHIYIYICISDERGHGILIFSQKHFFGNFLQKVTSSILHFFWGLIDSHVSKLTNNRSKLPSASMGREMAPGDCFLVTDLLRCTHS